MATYPKSVNRLSWEEAVYNELHGEAGGKGRPDLAPGDEELDLLWSERTDTGVPVDSVVTQLISDAHLKEQDGDEPEELD